VPEAVFGRTAAIRYARLRVPENAKGAVRVNCYGGLDWIMPPSITFVKAYSQERGIDTT
jgi:hypothetical protein